MQLYVTLTLLLSGALCANSARHTHAPTTTPAPDAVRLQKLEQVSEQLARQLMLQQLYVEERTRSEGDSGLKQVGAAALSVWLSSWCCPAMREIICFMFNRLVLLFL